MRTALLVLLLAAPAAADPDDWDLAHAVARVAANEGSLSAANGREVALIWQVTQGHGTTSAERLAWLRQHSSCVLTDRELEPRELRSNCPWSRHLRMDDEQPAQGWPSNLRWETYRDAWWRTRTLALALVEGRARIRPPCPEQPFTWGSRRLDMARAVERGLRPLGCTSLNEGFALR